MDGHSSILRHAHLKILICQPSFLVFHLIARLIIVNQCIDIFIRILVEPHYILLLQLIFLAGIIDSVLFELLILIFLQLLPVFDRVRRDTLLIQEGCLRRSQVVVKRCAASA